MANPVVEKSLIDQLQSLLATAYTAEVVEDLVPRIEDLVVKASGTKANTNAEWVDESDVMLITYGDSILDDSRPPLEVLDAFLRDHVADEITNVHILPCFPWTSDDGFSVTDYREINPDLGDWSDVARLSEKFGIMLDGVINHISRESAWFKEFLNDHPKYRDYFHICDPTLDYSAVTRPRALPLLTKVEAAGGERHVWTTFSDDQIDLNYENPDVLIEILDLLIFYAQQGARFIRLDAIGFMWKKLGTTCMHLPETHALIQVMRLVLDAAAPGVMLITETNVPHIDNISYFGDGTNEAHMVYQFPLPPLTLFAFLTGNAKPLSDWAASLEPTTPQTTYFNFLSSHDGIGMRPVEGILTPEEVARMAAIVEANGGRISMRNLPDGGTAPYELNITYLDAVTSPEDDTKTRAAKFLAAQTVLLSVVGVPGIYIHSLLGSRNDYVGLAATGRNRSINREKLVLADLTAELSDPEHLRSMVLDGHRHRLAIRRSRPAFRPSSQQRVVPIDDRLFSLVREGNGDRVWTVINVSEDDVSFRVKLSDLGFGGAGGLKDLLSGRHMETSDGWVETHLVAYATLWCAELV